MSPKYDFLEIDFWMIFWVAKKLDFCRFWVPKLKGGIPLFGCFFDIFHVFSSFGCFPRFWVIFHGQGDQKYQNNNKKTTLTASLATSSSPPAPHHQSLINKAERTVLTYPWHPHQPFQLNGRAVVPALPVQSARPFSNGSGRVRSSLSYPFF